MSLDAFPLKMHEKLRMEPSNNTAKTIFLVAGIAAIYIPLCDVVTFAIGMEGSAAKEAFMCGFELKHFQLSQLTH
jgi:ABC-type spermidine/putrescine transport system permease subunit II